MKIVNLVGREILDSRGNPTVEAEITLYDGTRARASVPSGASTGTKEALELRDSDNPRFHNKGVLTAVNNLNSKLREALLDQDVFNQTELDRIMLELDGTENKSSLGANAILAASVACATAASYSLKLPLWRYLGGIGTKRLPVPMINIINGGAHASNNLDIQEFMIVPSGFQSFREAIRCAAEIFASLKGICKKLKFSTSVGDEGGFAPDLSNHEAALKLILQAIEEAGYQAGRDVFLALDCAASEFFQDGYYTFEGKKLTSDELIDYLAKLASNYPIVSIEDGMSELDEYGWIKLTEKLGSRVQLVGDDVFVTNPKILRKGIKNKIANSLLVKINQIGTLTETVLANSLATRAGYTTVVSHRSGETESSFIADLAVGLDCGQIKTGSMSRSDRIAKYNQLLRIEEQQGKDAVFAGSEAFSRSLPLVTLIG